MIAYRDACKEDSMASSLGSSEKTDEKPQAKIYCANCEHCKLVQAASENSGQYVLRVRCDAGMWKKKLGGEKYYKYFTVARRSLDKCEHYAPMGDPKEFIKELRKTLPIKDEVYGLKSS